MFAILPRLGTPYLKQVGVKVDVLPLQASNLAVAHPAVSAENGRSMGIHPFRVGLVGLTVLSDFDQLRAVGVSERSSLEQALLLFLTQSPTDSGASVRDRLIVLESIPQPGIFKELAKD